jgi:hypothetical protein
LGSLGGSSGSSIHFIVLSMADNLAGCLISNLHLQYWQQQRVDAVNCLDCVTVVVFTHLEIESLASTVKVFQRAELGR